jgi:hypothetical protein
MEKRIIACVNDGTRWDPDIRDDDFTDFRLDHPDPEIRKRIKICVRLEDEKLEYYRLLGKRVGPNMAQEKERMCLHTPEYSQCKEKMDELKQQFESKARKVDFAMYLDQMIECGTIENTCIAASAKPKGKK